MTNYMGKKRLTKFLKNYLNNTAPEKLAELKREEKEWGDDKKYKYLYSRYKGSERMAAYIVFGGVVYEFKIFSAVKHKTGSRIVSLTETRTFEANGKEYTDIVYKGYALYTESFVPVDGEGSGELFCKNISK